MDSGLTGREQCTVCEEILAAEEIIAPLGHTFELLSDGSSQCSVCKVMMPAQSVGSAVTSPMNLVVFAGMGLLLLIVVIVLFIVLRKLSSTKKALTRATEFHTWESKSRR